MTLFAIVDKKSGVADYFLSRAREDAVRSWFIIAHQSPQMWNYIEDFVLIRVSDFPDVVSFPDGKNADFVLSGEKLLEQFEARQRARKERSAD